MNSSTIRSSVCVCACHPQCYYIEPIQREVSRPVSNGLPADKICQRLKKSSSEICSVQFCEWAPVLPPLV